MKSNIASVLCLFAHDKLMYFRVDGKLEPKFVLEGHQLGVISVDVNIGATSMFHFMFIVCLCSTFLCLCIYCILQQRLFCDTFCDIFSISVLYTKYVLRICPKITLQWLLPVAWTAVFASGTLRPANSVKPSTLDQVRAGHCLENLPMNYI